MMKTTTQLAHSYHQFYFGPNWTASHFREQISDVSFDQATTKLEGYPTIAELVYHIHYFTRVAMGVLKGGPLTGHDRFSFDVPEMHSEAEWQSFLQEIWNEAHEMTGLIEALPDRHMAETFVEDKYGSYFRNILGIIEHGHYHLGQIALIRKQIKNNH